MNKDKRQILIDIMYKTPIIRTLGTIQIFSLLGFFMGIMEWIWGDFQTAFKIALTSIIISVLVGLIHNWLVREMTKGIDKILEDQDQEGTPKRSLFQDKLEERLKEENGK